MSSQSTSASVDLLKRRYPTGEKSRRSRYDSFSSLGLSAPTNATGISTSPNEMLPFQMSLAMAASVAVHGWSREAFSASDDAGTGSRLRVAGPPSTRPMQENREP